MGFRSLLGGKCVSLCFFQKKIILGRICFLWIVAINRRLHLDLNHSKHAEVTNYYRSLDATQWSHVYSMLKWIKIDK